jgi:hypothetical protein
MQFLPDGGNARFRPVVLELTAAGVVTNKP